MPCRRRSKFENPICRTTVFNIPSIFCVNSASSAVLSFFPARFFFRKLNVVISPKTEAVSQYAIGGWTHQRPLRFTGQNAMNPVAEFMRQSHHVVIGTEVIQKRERLRPVSGKHERAIKSPATFAFGRGRINALGRNEALG